jgi:uncharacterized membrane protein YgcG
LAHATDLVEVRGMRALRAFLLCAALSGPAACIQLPTTGDSDGGTTGTADAATTPQAVGANCTQEPGTSVTLCQAVSVCPNLAIDLDQFPSCGFRVHSDAIDLECVCNGESLCPMGAPVTCDEAQQLLSSQTVVGVCDQVNEDRCTSVSSASGAGGGGGGGGSGGGGGTCDATCAGECGGNPTCLQQCGC